MAENPTILASLDQAFEQAIYDGVYAGAVAFAKNKSGTLNYAKSFGKRSHIKDGPNRPMELNTILAIASATKLITSISALQIVERGYVDLDDDLTNVIPLIGKQEVLHGLDEQGKPITKKRQNPLTLRQLLTHSAGASYPLMNPVVDAWRKDQGLPLGTGGTFEERITQPLFYEPGTSWEYGTNIDWAGKVVEHFSGQTLEDYFGENILKPLGIKDITFWPKQRPELEARLAKMTGRRRPGDRVVDYNGPLITDGLTECYGGHGGYADLSQYIEILHSILLDDERLLKKETTAQMFIPQLKAEKSKSELNREIGKEGAMYIGEFPDTKDYDHGLGGMLIGNDYPGWRKQGRLTWSGMFNIFWFIDREAGFCGVFGTQVLPPGDKQVEKVLTIFERAIYEENAALQGQKGKL